MEDIATVNAFQNGEVDTTTIDGGRATADLFERISGMNDVQVRIGFSTATSVYLLGRNSDLFKDPAARKAFALATDRRLLVEIRYQGMDWKEEPPGSGLIYPWQDGYRDNIADLDYSPQQANRVLDEAGWKMGDDGYRHKDGRLAEFNYVDFGDQPVFAAMARAQQKMALDIGLKMNIDVRKTSDFSKTLHDGTFDVVGMSWQGFTPFGQSGACQIYCSDSESNFSHVGSTHIDELLKAVSTVKDQRHALEAFNEAESEALHLFGLFPTYNGPSVFIVKQGLANFGPAGFLTVDPEDIGWQK
jgi:peptide/nickel transport system substrate-binding protein